MAVGLGLGGLVLPAFGCTRANPRFDLGASDDGIAAASSSGGPELDSTDTGFGGPPGPAGSSGADDEGTSAAPATTGAGEATDDASAETFSGSTSDDGTCDAIDDDAYAPCFDGPCPSGTCSVGPAAGPIQHGTSVCQPSCLVDCDCPSVSGTEAEPRCRDAQCVLDCADGSQCPSGMTCADERCAWSSAYGMCGAPDCPSGFLCFYFEPEPDMPSHSMCPAIGCEVEGVLHDELCPAPATGNAIPQCIGAEGGWCVLPCVDGVTTCPDGAACIEDYCVYPT